MVGSLTHFCLEILHRTQTSSTELFTTVFFIDHLHISSSSLSFKMNSVISPQTPCPSIYTSQTPSIRLITNYLIIYNNWRSMSPNRSIFVLYFFFLNSIRNPHYLQTLSCLFQLALAKSDGSTIINILSTLYQSEIDTNTIDLSSLLTTIIDKQVHSFPV